MDGVDPLASLGLALALGLLIGFEREQRAPEKRTKGGSFIGGARTFPLVALAGALSSMLVPIAGNAALLLVLLGLMCFLLVSYIDDVRHDRDRGMTTEVAFVLTFLLGALSTSTDVIEPLSRRAVVLAAAAVVVTLVLSQKPRLHGVAQRASREDILATLKFLLVAVVVLPLLPNRTLGPLAVLNPFKIGLLVALIAGVDFVGYVLVRVLGPGRGLGVTGLVGGFASSTAVTLSMSNRAREEPKLASACALAVVTASSVMPPRVLALVALVHRPLVSELWAPILAMTVAGGVSAYVLLSKSREQSSKASELEITNPFELSAALKWAAIFTGVMFLSKLATDHFGTSGSYIAGLVAGTTDVDAISLSMASLAKSGLPANVAALSIALALASNTLVKATMAIALGGWSYGRHIAAGFGAMLAAGGATLAVVSMT